MDPLRRDDIELARGTSPEERARQTLEMMRTGYRLKRSALRVQYPQESEEQIPVVIVARLVRPGPPRCADP